MSTVENPYAERRRAAHVLLDAAVSVDEEQDEDTNELALRLALDPVLRADQDATVLALGAVDVIALLARVYAARRALDVASVVATARRILDDVYESFDDQGHEGTA